MPRQLLQLRLQQNLSLHAREVRNLTQTTAVRVNNSPMKTNLQLVLAMLLISVGSGNAQSTNLAAIGATEYARALKYNWEIPAQEREARKWIARAAQHGHVKAQIEMAQNLIAPGAPVSARAEALRWLGLAAAQQSAEAMYLIGAIHADLQFTDWPKDYAEAAKWLKRAAELGHGLAQSAMAELCWEGRGVQKSKSESYGWSALAVGCIAATKVEFDPRNAGPEAIKAALQKLAQTTLAVQAKRAKEMTAAEIAEGEAFARSFRNAHHF